MSPEIQALLRRLLRCSAKGEGTAAIASNPAAREALARGWIQVQGERARATNSGVAEFRRVRTLAQAQRAELTVSKTSAAHEATSSASALTVSVEPTSPLAWLSRRRDRDGNPLITPEQLAAGERLSADLWRARMTPRVTSSWSGVPGEGGRRGAPGAGIDVPDIVIAAKARVELALTAVGPELAGLLIDICGELRGIEDLERSNGWPQRSGKIILQLAMTRLARHYGLLPQETPQREMKRRMMRWIADDAEVHLGRWQA